jgi:glycosyltransferase involved in cell wall biosynthesis
MQQGLPCISTNEGGIPNIIDQEKTGFVIEKKNPQQIADKINYLINHQEVCKQMGENGYKKYQKEFTLNTFENRLKDILIKCCDKTLKP